ncbi:hypothetical protein LCM20_16380 [Halobacillus litoralis]|uniref:hypothetical protein n=1 Tax=Halobacillus litoralis TaxID=45668 RepID=UPI001CD2E2E9|nr:hypothetical protein [Halobacillus litoralis]MCA0972186.1 hypothetical protein [Halobacillus litoralis]
MLKRRKHTRTEWALLFIIILMAAGGSTYYVMFYTPKSSLELYQKINFVDDSPESFMLEGYEHNLDEGDLEYIRNNRNKGIGQFTVFEYEEKSYVLATTLGAGRLHVMAVEELPEEMSTFLTDLYEKE